MRSEKVKRADHLTAGAACFSKNLRGFFFVLFFFYRQLECEGEVNVVTAGHYKTDALLFVSV